MNQTLVRHILRFALVGAIGFAIDAGLLYLLVRAGVSPYLARGISFPPAVTATWYLNRVWTFSVPDARAGQQYARYVAVQIGGALSNYAVYALILSVIPVTPERAVGALAVASSIALILNFSGAKMLVFVSHHSPQTADAQRIDG